MKFYLKNLKLIFFDYSQLGDKFYEYKKNFFNCSSLYSLFDKALVDNKKNFLARFIKSNKFFIVIKILFFLHFFREEIIIS